MKQAKNICEEVLDIMSSRDKFINNVGAVEFLFKKYAKPAKSAVFAKNLVDYATYSAHSERELEDFYDAFRLRGYGGLKIMRVVKLNNKWKMGYYVEMAKDYDEFSLYAEMVLETYLI